MCPFFLVDVRPSQVGELVSECGAVGDDQLRGPPLRLTADEVEALR